MSLRCSLGEQGLEQGSLLVQLLSRYAVLCVGIYPSTVVDDAVVCVYLLFRMNKSN